MRVELGSPADIHFAVASHNLEALVRHVTLGGDVNAKLQGATPLGSALCRKAWDTAQLLLSLGADVNRCSRDSVGREEPPLCTACRLGSLDIARTLLRDPGIKVGRRDLFGKTPVWLAAKHGRADLVHLLLVHNANVRSAAGFADCPLWLCARYGGRSVIAALLLAAGCGSTHCDGSGRDAVHWAKLRGDAELLLVLGEAGARVYEGTCAGGQGRAREGGWGGALGRRYAARVNRHPRSAAGDTGTRVHEEAEQSGREAAACSGIGLAQPPRLCWLARRAYWIGRANSGEIVERDLLTIPPLVRSYVLLRDILPEA